MSRPPSPLPTALARSAFALAIVAIVAGGAGCGAAAGAAGAASPRGARDGVSATTLTDAKLVASPPRVGKSHLVVDEEVGSSAGTASVAAGPQATGDDSGRAKDESDSEPRCASRRAAHRGFGSAK